MIDQDYFEPKLTKEYLQHYSNNRTYGAVIHLEAEVSEREQTHLQNEAYVNDLARQAIEATGQRKTELQAQVGRLTDQQKWVKDHVLLKMYAEQKIRVLEARGPLKHAFMTLVGK